MANEKLDFGTNDERNLLLMKVLQASESDMQEEEVKEELYEGLTARVQFIRIIYSYANAVPF